MSRSDEVEILVRRTVGVEVIAIDGSCASSGALVGEVESGVTKLLGFLHKGDCAGTHCPLVLLHTAPGSQHLADALQ